MCFVDFKKAFGHLSLEMLCVSVCVLYVHIKTDTLPHLYAPCKQMCLNGERQKIHVLVRLGILPLEKGRILVKAEYLLIILYESHQVFF